MSASKSLGHVALDNDDLMALPLRMSKAEVGSVIDANGDEVFVVDVHREKSDNQVRAIAARIVDAVNATRAVP